MKRTSRDTILKPIHLEQGEGRTPGWGGVARRQHVDFIPTHMASEILNFTNRQGIHSYNIGTLSTRPGYANSPNYQLHGLADDNAFIYLTRMFAKFYPGAEEASDGETVEFDGTGLNDLTVDTACPHDKVIELTIDATGTPDTFSWTDNGVEQNTGVAITGAIQEIGTTGLKVKYDATTGHTVGDISSISPISTLERSPQVLRLGKAGDASVFSKFNPATGNFDAITSNLSGQWYPQHIIYDVPAGPYFCWIDPDNGLHVYDGTDDVAQAIPKYDDTGNISGAMWLIQIDGRIVVTGNFTDTGQRNALYYCAPGDYTKWESHEGGGQIALYTDDDENSQVRNVTGMVAFQGLVIVFTNDGRFVISGIGTTSQTMRFFPGYGCVSGKTIVKKKNALYWWGKEGAYEWNGNEPIEIGQLIMPELFEVSYKKSLSFFSFAYEDQWWTNVIRTDGLYRNFVFDFTTRQWFIHNIPMSAAWSSVTGLLDAGILYFASPEAINTGDAENPVWRYFHYAFGVDPLNGHQAVYADKVTGVKAARTGTAIDAEWVSGRMDFGDIFVKDYWFLHARIGTSASTPLADNGVFTHARIDYDLDDDTGLANQLDFTTTASTPYHSLNFAAAGDVENETKGTLLQLKISVSATKRLDIKKVYVEYRPMNIMQNET